ncbi:MAG: hypothetical protein KAI47_25070 [Deltaproteobacteria bacterium]|nr:hypothetical protein [Deltaproteobacteria bacterium]
MSKKTKLLKQEFLDKYNPERTIKRAIDSGIAAASQHNVLYSKSCSVEKKKEIKYRWCIFLTSLIDRYKGVVSVAKYEQDITRLKSQMNKEFRDGFRDDGNSSLEPGFRISHAQKSISVFLKHMWCMGKVHTPPQCPVDRVVLIKAGLSGNNAGWTHVNSIKEHRVKVGFLIEAMTTKDGSLSEWELRSFSF